MSGLNTKTLPALQAAGYVVGHTLFGAPYDWRVPASAQPQLLTDLQVLIENASTLNGGRKVALYAVSYGPDYALSFLHRMPQAWKDKYIAWMVADSPIWGGVPSALFMYVSGYLGVGNGTSLMTEIAKAVARETAVPWGFPRGGLAGYNTTTPLVTTESRSYTALQYHELLADLGASSDECDLVEWLMGEPDLANFSSPGVDTLVVCGIDVPTPSNATFDTGLGTRGDWQLNSLRTTTDGDGVSPPQSCLRVFAGEGDDNHSVVRSTYAGMMHASCSYSNPTNASAPNSRCFADMMRRINGGNATLTITHP